MAVSSANIAVSSFCSVGRSSVYIKYKMGLKTLPYSICGEQNCDWEMFRFRW
jgi:hypothetical protein